MGTYFLFPHGNFFFPGVLMDLLEPSLEPFLAADCSASSPPVPSPRGEGTGGDEAEQSAAKKGSRDGSNKSMSTPGKKKFPWGNKK